MLGPYCRSKYLADQTATKAAANGVPVIIVLPTLPVGPGDYGLTPPTRMILDLIRGKTPAYLQCLLNLIDVRDVATGAILARDRGTIGERYILGHQDLWMSDLLQKLNELASVPMPKRRVPYGVALAVAYINEWISDWITGRPPRAPLTGIKLAGRKVRFDSQKATSTLGLSHRDIDDTLNDQLHWFFERGLTDTDHSAFSDDQS
jgi:dihydroflavonol-4-reductase